MNPYFDETLILVLSASLEEVCTRATNIEVQKESSSHTFIEGICHEVCYGSQMDGPINGYIFWGMDSTSHSLLQPTILDTPAQITTSIVDAASLYLYSQTLTLCQKDLGVAYPKLEFKEPTVFNNKIVSLPKDSYRKYRMIFFLREKKTQTYIGRLYLIAALSKNSPT